MGMWQSRLKPAYVDMLIAVYLSYLNTHLAIYRLLEENDPSVKQLLLSTAAQMLAVVIRLGNVRDRPVPLAYVVWNWGMPSVAVLTSALAQARSSQQPLPNGLSKAEIVRNLSVFASYLENLFKPDNANHKMTKQVSTTIVRTLDDVLDDGSNGEMAANLDGNHDPLASENSGSNGQALDITSSRMDPAPIQDTIPGWPYDEQGFAEWMTAVDWTAVTNNEWSFT
ncbi:Hypothetical protein R9X50_00646000 [Acrodontium crateriforme]|uniref:Uncharacterized protein n=1 Tax=Acrodontium crateriforme TaxID=150365 RepID=A0AAQ3MB09_9PEZI|nr:Hypothetical protein R9X50_00646000 [Acrodontium crateriforme]